MIYYQVNYIRSDTKLHESKTVFAKNSKESVKKVINHAKKYLVDLSCISVSIEGQQVFQKMCDKCQIQFGDYGIIINYKKYNLCKGCAPNEPNI